jgi:hypothetical protein
VFQYAEAGTYTLTLVAQNECSTDTFTKQVTILPNGVDESFARSVVIAPHPVTDYAEIRFSNPAQAPTLLILSDMQGKEMLRLQTRSETALLDCNGLAPGIYLLRISGPGNAVVKVVME